MVLWFYVCDLAYDTMSESLLDHFCPQFSDPGASLSYHSFLFPVFCFLMLCCVMLSLPLIVRSNAAGSANRREQRIWRALKVLQNEQKLIQQMRPTENEW